MLRRSSAYETEWETSPSCYVKLFQIYQTSVDIVLYDCE